MLGKGTWPRTGGRANPPLILLVYDRLSIVDMTVAVVRQAETLCQKVTTFYLHHFSRTCLWWQHSVATGHTYDSMKITLLLARDLVVALEVRVICSSHIHVQYFAYVNVSPKTCKWRQNHRNTAVLDRIR